MDLQTSSGGFLLTFKRFSEVILMPVASILGATFGLIGLVTGKVQFFLLGASSFIFVLMLIDRLELKEDA